jgi:ABC-type nitrate/sulfonate/bicarbonate transport system ATPase subunit
LQHTQHLFFNLSCFQISTGINLSGGQRQRCALARALYASSSSSSATSSESASFSKLMIYDDPLSAVDAGVSAHLFEHACLGPVRLPSEEARTWWHTVQHTVPTPVAKFDS